MADISTIPEKQGFMDSQSSLEPKRDSHRAWRLVVWAIRYVVIVVVVGTVLAIPMIIFRDDRSVDDTENLENRHYRNLVFYLFAWLEITWLAGVASDIFILAFPYVFWLVSRYVNPAHHRYWRIFRFIRLPVTLLGTIIATFIAFNTLINTNDQLAVNFKKAPDSWGWDDTIDDILSQASFWVAFYVLEKILILYITIHYHYRADQTRNVHSKEMHRALVTLYEASVYLHPVNSKRFVVEDTTIRDTNALKESSRIEASKFLRRLGFRRRSISRFFGGSDSHWMNINGPYTVIERALSDPKSAAAIATRIWKSIVLNGKEAMTAEDIAEVLGPYRREEALECFKVLDENESGDIRLDEFVWTIIEAGRVRSAIYEGMMAINHCINTLDWIALIVLAFVMIFFISLLYIPTIKDIKDSVSFIAIGLGFAAGRTVNKFLTGCIFVFFEHPFDIGDRVEVFNLSSTQSVGCFVTGQSVLYTVFRRVDNNTVMQLPNDRLALFRIENITRSGANRESRGISIHFKTPFSDIMALRSEMEAFLKENSRDYQPALGLSVSELSDLSSMELKIGFTHKHNWSNDQLRARRSNKFMCALMAAIRRVGILKPAGLPQGGDESRPIYQVSMTEEAARKAKGVVPTKEAAEEEEAFKKLTKVPEVEKKTLSNGDEVDTSLLQGSTGLRTRNGGVFHT